MQLKSFFNPERSQMRKKIWQLTLPVILANITVPFVGMVDTAVMGHQGEAYYIGAVANGCIIFSLVTITFGFLRMATTGLVAQAFGSGDEEKIGLHFMRGTALALMLGMLVVLLSYPLILLAQSLFSASPEVLEGMAIYLWVVLFAAPAVNFNMVVLGVLFGLQRVKSCMVQLIFINCLNIAGNLFLVLGLGMKIEGVALATLIAQWAGAGLSLWLVLRALGKIKPLNFPLSKIISFKAFQQYISLGRDLTIRTFGIVLGEFLVLNSSAALSDIALGASAICFVIFMVVAYGLDGFAHATESLVGEAIGKKDRSRLEIVIYDSSLIAFMVSVLMGLLVWVFAAPFFALMTDIAELHSVLFDLLPWLIVMPMVSVWAFQMDGVFVGAIEAKVMRNAMVVSVVLFIPLLYLGQALWGLYGIWSAFLFLMSLRGLTLWFKLGRVFALAQ